MTLEKQIEIIDGNLRAAYQQCVPGTMLCAHEIMQARKEDPVLCSKSFKTADGIVYSLDDDIPTLRITPGAKNPIFHDLDDAFIQLSQTVSGNYRVLPNHFIAAKEDPGTITINLTKLGNLGMAWREEWGKLVIPTSKPWFFNKGYDKLNAEARTLAECFYGRDSDFKESMRMLNDAGIHETHILVFKPGYVTKYAAKGPIARPSAITNFACDSSVNAGALGLFRNYCPIIGVRKTN